MGKLHGIRLTNKLVLEFNPHFNIILQEEKCYNQPLFPLSAPSGFGFMDSIIF